MIIILVLYIIQVFFGVLSVNKYTFDKNLWFTAWSPIPLIVVISLSLCCFKTKEWPRKLTFIVLIIYCVWWTLLTLIYFAGIGDSSNENCWSNSDRVRVYREIGYTETAADAFDEMATCTIVVTNHHMGNLIAMVINLFFDIWFTCTVYSYWQEWKEEKKD